MEFIACAIVILCVIAAFIAFVMFIDWKNTKDNEIKNLRASLIKLAAILGYGACEDAHSINITQYSLGCNTSRQPFTVEEADRATKNTAERFKALEKHLGISLTRSEKPAVSELVAVKVK